MHTRQTLVLATLALAATSLTGRQEGGVRVLDATFHHLGDSETPEWTEAPPTPEGTQLDLSFDAEARQRECLIALVQRHVNNRWSVTVNGREVAVLERGDEQREVLYTIPAGTLKSGTNTLSFVPDVTTDDITLGNVRLIDASLREHLRLGVVEVTVTDTDSGEPSPARVTITDADGEVVRLYYGESRSTAVREGVIYTSEGRARFEVPAGRYRAFATRGAEWGLGEAGFEVEGGGSAGAALSFRREVDTTGFVACDTHIHTLTFSGHGDSSVEERMVTLAGEGVELAISTDHNHNTDYRPYQERLGLGEYFTPVTGNEVTTPVGHFNGFPLDPNDEVPGYELEDPVKIVEGIRAKGAEVVVLNHPRWPDHEKGPWGALGLDRYTGERVSPVPITVDATELVNSETKEEDPLFLFTDWFALLNHGERIFAVGSSDSHTVGGPVGQGRTYVRSSTDDPARIDVGEAFAHIKAGRTSIGMGIFCDVLVDGSYSMGDVVPVEDGEVNVALRIASPSWVRPERLLVYVNGVAVSESRVPVRGAGPVDVRMSYPLELEHEHDAWLVCVVIGGAVDGPYWPMANAYTLAATNPVFLDVDRDGRHQSPRAIAEGLVAEHGLDPASVQEALGRCDDGVAVQVLSLARDAYLREASERLLRAGGSAGDKRAFVREFLDATAPER